MTTGPTWLGPFRDPRHIKPPTAVRTVSPPAEVDAHYRPAEMTIRRRLPEIEADWTRVWEDLGVLRPSTNAREQAKKSEQTLHEDLVHLVRNGDRIRDIKQEPGNIYGKIAFETYMRKGAVDVTVVAAPRQGPKFDVRIYPVEIDIKVNVLK